MPADADRLRPLDRIDGRLPDLDLGQHKAEWTRVPDGAGALVIDGGGFGGGGCFIANAGDDVHVIRTMAPPTPGRIRCVAIHADGTRELARLTSDPLDRWRGEGDD